MCKHASLEISCRLPPARKDWLGTVISARFSLFFLEGMENILIQLQTTPNMRQSKTLMRQSFVTTPPAPGNSGNFDFLSSMHAKNPTLRGQLAG